MVEVLTKAETLAAIKKATEPLAKELAILREVVEQNAELVDSVEASRLTGFSDNRTLKKHFTEIKVGTSIRFSKAEIIRWRHEQSLHKAPELRIQTMESSGKR
ncbi:hypothetical protein I5M27_12935 [Adhaeribacter sp. BT258]|uniref:Helix-turn-helix domain-containing protein n=1 Tax=Adhaeribacter terrigena TaxID=2793070 RepID=A0ABS1C5F1_9BACT|nr:hypothetical protein [Adhaeribacter terrigena]MBK0403893.1 hypothetical protein [Adhaeribacter terrigena]